MKDRHPQRQREMDSPYQSHNPPNIHYANTWAQLQTETHRHDHVKPEGFIYNKHETNKLRETHTPTDNKTISKYNGSATNNHQPQSQPNNTLHHNHDRQFCILKTKKAHTHTSKNHDGCFEIWQQMASNDKTLSNNFVVLSWGAQVCAMMEIYLYIYVYMYKIFLGGVLGGVTSLLCCEPGLLPGHPFSSEVVVVRDVWFGLFPSEAIKDGLEHDEVQKLAGLGNFGAQPSHVSRDLVRSLTGAFQQLPEVSLLRIPVRAAKLNEIVQLDLEVQYPHDIFAHYASKTSDFNLLFGSPAQVETYWNGKDVQDPAFRQHPALLQEDYRRRCIPCKLHSDGVVMSKAETLHVISWCSVLSSGGPLESQLLYGALVKSAACPETEQGPGTIPELYRALRWSFAACLNGRHPSRDWNDNAWAPGSSRAKLANHLLHPEGFFLGVFHLLGDLEEMANNYGLSHWASNEPCFWCEANTGDKPWTDFSPQAAWRASVREPQQVNPPPSDHQVWTIPGLCRWSVGWDVLHGLDLGPTLHVLGNVLEDLVKVTGIAPTFCTWPSFFSQAPLPTKGGTTHNQPAPTYTTHTHTPHTHTHTNQTDCPRNTPNLLS